MAFTIPTIFTAVDKFSTPLKGMGRGLDAFISKAETAVARQERVFRRLTPALSETTKQFLAVASSAAIASAAIGAVVFSGKSIMDYETAIANLSAITGTSGKQLRVKLKKWQTPQIPVLLKWQTPLQ